MSKYSRARTDWGDLFGLSTTDLTDQQLNKLHFDKLIEFISKDSRIDKIIGDRFITFNLEDWASLKEIEKEALPYALYTIQKYNECVRLRTQDIAKSCSSHYYNCRSNYIFWDLLDAENKKNEYKLWAENKTSVFEPVHADFKWWYESFPTDADNMVKKLIDDAKNWRNMSSASRMVGLLPEDPLNTYIDEIFKCDKSIYMHVLSNPNTSKNYTVKALRAIAGKRKKLPVISATLNKDMFSELPPVMRLNILESLLIYMRGGTITFSDMHKSEDLETLLFGTAIKYNYRVKRLVERFKFIYERKEPNIFG